MSAPVPTPPTPWTVRQCYPGDEANLQLIGGATFLETFAGVMGGGDIVTHWQVQHSQSLYGPWLADGEPRIWMAETEDRVSPIGYIVVGDSKMPLPDLGPDDIEIKRIYLLSRFHGQGAGQGMMDQALAHAQALGRKRILVGVYAGNVRAIRYFERNGFMQKGERRFTVGSTVYRDIIYARPV